ncbi:MAG TPA: aminodeoxychorismate lyase [Woeseiaceae bacterium]|nr:aminodeoxychorismate lyase [Woeseiaceae bacterium]
MTSAWFDPDGAIKTVPVDDRGLQYGDGVFDTIAIRHGRARLAHLHIERLRLGCERLGMQVPPAEQLLGMLDAAIASTGCHGSGVAKFVVTRGSGMRGYRYASVSTPRILLGIFESPLHARDSWTRGIGTRICNLRLASQPALAGMKTLNRLEQVLARNEWQSALIAEGLMLDADCNLVCGTMSNVFLVSDHGLLTPAITSAGVSGVMRRHIIAVVVSAGLTVAVEQIPVQRLAECHEVFVSNSQIGIWPVRFCGARSYAAPGPTTQRVMNLLADSGIEECRL